MLPGFRSRWTIPYPAQPCQGQHTGSNPLEYAILYFRRIFDHPGQRTNASGVTFSATSRLSWMSVACDLPHPAFPEKGGDLAMGDARSDSQRHRVPMTDSNGSGFIAGWHDSAVESDTTMSER